MQKLSHLETVLLCILLALGVLLCLPGIHSVQASNRRASCADNLKQMGLVFKMYANESPGNMFPPLGPIPENWLPDIQSISPDYLNDFELLVCPGNPLKQSLLPECLTSASYTYTGYLLTDDYDAVTLTDTWKAEGWEAIRHQSISPKFPYGLNENGRGGGGMYVLWDRVDLDTRRMAHDGRGINILYMDGHVEYEPYHPDNPTHQSPMTRVFGEVFGAIPELCPEAN